PRRVAGSSTQCAVAVMRAHLAGIVAPSAAPPCAPALGVGYPEPPPVAAARGPALDSNAPYFRDHRRGGRGNRARTHAVGPDAAAEQSTDGGLFGGTIGYNVDMNGVLLGVEADYGWAAIDGKADCPNPAFSCRSSLESFGTVRGRLGWAKGRLLLFGTGGVAF